MSQQKKKLSCPKCKNRFKDGESLLLFPSCECAYHKRHFESK